MKNALGCRGAGPFVFPRAFPLAAASEWAQDRDIRQIVEEVQKHPETIRQAFDLMNQGFETVQAAKTAAP